MAEEAPALTDEEKYELALQTEHELARLARTYTIMERNRAEFMQAGACGKLAKHRKVLDIFIKEQKNILTDLAVRMLRKQLNARLHFSENVLGSVSRSSCKRRCETIEQIRPLTGRIR